MEKRFGQDVIFVAEMVFGVWTGVGSGFENFITATESEDENVTPATFDRNNTHLHSCTHFCFTVVTCRRGIPFYLVAMQAIERVVHSNASIIVGIWGRPVAAVIWNSMHVRKRENTACHQFLNFIRRTRRVTLYQQVVAWVCWSASCFVRFLRLRRSPEVGRRRSEIEARPPRNDWWRLQVWRRSSKC